MNTFSRPISLFVNGCIYETVWKKTHAARRRPRFPSFVYVNVRACRGGQRAACRGGQRAACRGGQRAACRGLVEVADF